MEYLFDSCKPQFRVWVAVYDINTRTHGGETLHAFTELGNSDAGPLYYAALCGFHDLVEHLITRYSQDVNADGGYYGRPLMAALAGEHFQTADLLHHNGADTRVQGKFMMTLLHYAAYYGNLKVAQKLIEHEARI